MNGNFRSWNRPCSEDHPSRWSRRLDHHHHQHPGCCSAYYPPPLISYPIIITFDKQHLSCPGGGSCTTTCKILSAVWLWTKYNQWDLLFKISLPKPLIDLHHNCDHHHHLIRLARPDESAACRLHFHIRGARNFHPDRWAWHRFRHH